MRRMAEIEREDTKMQFGILYLLTRFVDSHDWRFRWSIFLLDAMSDEPRKTCASTELAPGCWIFVKLDLRSSEFESRPNFSGWADLRRHSTFDCHFSFPRHIELHLVLNKLVVSSLYSILSILGQLFSSTSSFLDSRDLFLFPNLFPNHPYLLTHDQDNPAFTSDIRC